MSKAPEIAPQQVWFAVNISRGNKDKTLESNEWLGNVKKEVMKGIKESIPWNLNAMNFLMLQNIAYGPFTTKKHALSMAPAELDDDSKDLWKKEIWTAILIPNVFDESELEYPDWSLCSIKYVCTECKSLQIFKGSCVECKSQNKPYTPTIKVRDWDGELS